MPDHDEIFGDDPIGVLAGRIATDIGVSAFDDETLRQVSLRIPHERLVMVDVLASNADMSRNAMINQLIKAGAHELLERLPSPIRDDIMEEVHNRLETQ